MTTGDAPRVAARPLKHAQPEDSGTGLPKRVVSAPHIIVGLTGADALADTQPPTGGRDGNFCSTSESHSLRLGRFADRRSGTCPLRWPWSQTASRPVPRQSRQLHDETMKAG
jgi:hypothetical protein